MVGEHRSSGERKHYLSNLPADTPIKALVGAIKARWVCEQAHQKLKGELGLDHFKARSWVGLHRHALMTMIAYAVLQSRRLAHAGREKGCRDRPHNQPYPQPGRPSSTISPSHRPFDVRAAKRCSSVISTLICQSSVSKGSAFANHNKEVWGRRPQWVKGNPLALMSLLLWT